MFATGLIALMLLADEGAGAPGDAPAPPATTPPAEVAPPAVPPPAPAAEPAPPPPLPELPPPRQRRYGDQGSIEIGLGIGYSTETGFVGAASGRYYVIDRVAPGIEGTFVAGSSGNDASRYGLLLAALRVIPVRVSSLALALTGRAGRVLLGDHPDGWGVGGAAAILFLFSPTVGLELGYEALQLLPSSFCADLESCWIHGPVIAVRFGF